MDSELKLDFLGIGVVKSGTTWLADCLREHPEIYLPYQKEINYFDFKGKDSNYSKGFKWYKKFFKSAPENLKKGEFTTHYLFSPESHKLIRKHYPEVKLIVCLRRPEDMLYSFYWWKKANFSHSSLADAFEEELERDADLLERGMYYKQLRPYFDNFPNENIKVFLFDDIKSDPNQVLKDLYKFLEVKEDFRPSVANKKVNRSKTVKYKLLADVVSYGINSLDKFGFRRFILDLQSNRKLSSVYSAINKKSYIYPTMPDKTKKKLIAYYKTETKKLESLINRDLDNWME